jgi:hypothetical protein
MQPAPHSKSPPELPVIEHGTIPLHATGLTPLVRLLHYFPNHAIDADFGATNT